MELTQKIRIFPTEEQEDVLWILSEKCRLLYNFALGHRNDKAPPLGGGSSLNKL